MRKLYSYIINLFKPVNVDTDIHYIKICLGEYDKTHRPYINSWNFYGYTVLGYDNVTRTEYYDNIKRTYKILNSDNSLIRLLIKLGDAVFGVNPVYEKKVEKNNLDINGYSIHYNLNEYYSGLEIFNNHTYNLFDERRIVFSMLFYKYYNKYSSYSSLTHGFTHTSIKYNHKKGEYIYMAFDINKIFIFNKLSYIQENCGKHIANIFTEYKRDMKLNELLNG